MSDWSGTNNNRECKGGRKNIKDFSTAFIPFLSEFQFRVCTSFSLIYMCMWWGVRVGGFFPPLRSVHFYFVVIYFWPAIRLMHQLVKAKCELACQHSLCISVNFCLLKTFLQQPATERTEAKNQ